jgi:hypothetical protein
MKKIVRSVFRDGAATPSVNLFDHRHKIGIILEQARNGCLSLLAVFWQRGSQPILNDGFEEAPLIGEPSGRQGLLIDQAQDLGF